LLAAGAMLSLPFAAAPVQAQFQLNVCGAPPLPPCERGPRVIERERVRDFGTVCRTRYERCREEDPRPIGARCTCENDDGEEVIGRIVR
jgi:hypothetical protein